MRNIVIIIFWDMKIALLSQVIPRALNNGGVRALNNGGVGTYSYRAYA
jgi:hypothetical protein